MKTEQTRITVKGQTNVPQKIQKFLGVKSGGDVEWHVVKSRVMVNRPRKIKDPVKFLTSQVRLDLDAVRLVRSTREEF